MAADFPKLAWLVNHGTPAKPEIKLITDPDMAAGFEERELFVPGSKVMHPLRARILEAFVDQGTSTEIGERFGVDNSHVSRIRTGKAWAK
jgi:hypothetical protein